VPRLPRSFRRASATVFTLFVLGHSVAEHRAAEALGDGLEAALGLGALVSDGDDVHATLRIVPHDILLVASDLPSLDLAKDHVAAAHQPSLTLARLTVRRRVRQALDIGTGNGIQALVLAQHADHVVATDASDRALEFTAFNAALNGTTNIETRQGSWLEPVAGERFGVVVCSPPYVVSPGAGPLYRDGNLRGDVLSEHLVRDVPAYLEEGAYATVLVSWIPGSPDATPAPVGWTGGSGCDALVLALHRESAHAAAAAWNEGEALESWLDFYRREGIGQIAYGAVVLHRRGGGRTWRDSIELPGGPVGHASEHLVRIFAAHEQPAPRVIRELRLAPAGDVVVDGLVLTQRGGLGLRVQLDAVGAAIVQRLAETGRVDVACAAVARDLGEDRVALGALGEDLVEQLYELGFIVAVR
jgi:SAM-dependent methyltransferase